MQRIMEKCLVQSNQRGQGIYTWVIDEDEIKLKIWLKHILLLIV